MPSEFLLGLRNDLLAMQSEDLRVRQELIDSGELGGRYVPRMEAVHTRNAERLASIVADHGWPDESMVGKDGAGAAWLIVQHAIGFPRLQRQCLLLLQKAGEEERIPLWHYAYLADRIAMYENKPQRYGTQWIDDCIDGRARPWRLEDADQVQHWRASVGLPALPAIPECGAELPVEQQRAMREIRHWWEEWLVQKGWHQSDSSEP